MITVLAALALGAVFVVSGAAKIARPDVWRAHAADIGAPRLVIAPLPYAELALGALLMAQWQRRWSSVAALVLLTAFTVLIGVRLLQGRRPACACFGTWSTAPIGWVHVVRNVGLMGVATLVVAAG